MTVRVISLTCCTMSLAIEIRPISPAAFCILYSSSVGYQPAPSPEALLSISWG